MTQPTVTLPREVVQSAMELLIDYQSDCADYEGPEGIEFIEKGIATLRAALDAPATTIPAHPVENSISGAAAYLVKSKSANWKGIFEFEGDSLNAVNDKAAPKDVEIFALDIRKPVDCTDFDQFQALPPIVLTKVTK